MFLLYKKEGGYIVGKLPFVDNPKNIIRGRKVNDIDYIEIVDSDMPQGDIKNYKVIDGLIVEMSKKDKDDWDKIKNPSLKIIKLEQEIELLYSAIAELSMLIGGFSNVYPR